MYKQNQNTRIYRIIQIEMICSIIVTALSINHFRCNYSLPISVNTHRHANRLSSLEPLFDLSWSPPNGPRFGFTVCRNGAFCVHLKATFSLTECRQYLCVSREGLLKPYTLARSTRLSVVSSSKVTLIQVHAYRTHVKPVLWNIQERCNVCVFKQIFFFRYTLKAYK